MSIFGIGRKKAKDIRRERTLKTLREKRKATKENERDIKMERKVRRIQWKVAIAQNKAKLKRAKARR